MPGKVRREFLFGVAPCLAALRAERRKIYKMYLNDKFQKEEPNRELFLQLVEEAKLKDINIKYRKKIFLDKFSQQRPHQNVLMQASALDYSGQMDRVDHLPSKNQIWLALDQIHDPMNFGAIIRSAFYFGVDKVIVTESNSCGLTPIVSKASAGAMEWMPISTTTSLEKLLEDALYKDWEVIGTVKENEKMSSPPFNTQDLELEKSSIIVLGNEGYGLRESVAKLCSQMVTIATYNPNLPPDLDSLNVSVATGILLHSLLRGRRAV